MDHGVRYGFELNIECPLFMYRTSTYMYICSVSQAKPRSAKPSQEPPRAAKPGQAKPSGTKRHGQENDEI